jgi:mRNA interferase MazF
MNNYSKDAVILVRYPFSDLTLSKVRPAVVVGATRFSQDILIVPLTSKTQSLLPGEFVLKNWKKSGLNTTTAVKRGVYTIEKRLVIKTIGKLSKSDAEKLENSLKEWLEL